MLPEQVTKAQRLLYSIYCTELSWQPAKNNPSNLKIEDGALVDDYDRQGLSIWYGVFDQKKPNEIVATRRVLHRDSAGCLELARYVIPSELRRLLASNQQVVEMNRSCIKKTIAEPMFGRGCYMRVLNMLLRIISKLFPPRQYLRCRRCTINLFF